MLKKIKERLWSPEVPMKRRVAGLVLIILGVLVILSAILVPLINHIRNRNAINELKSNIPVVEETATPEAVEVTQESVTTTQPAVEPTLSPEQERAQRRAALLQTERCIGIVTIDKINVELAVAEGTDDEILKKAVGHMTETAGIGQPGNCVISAHHGGYYGEFFQNVDKLESGDIIEMTDVSGTIYKYVVYDKKIVHRADWTVIENLGEESTLTLITCVDETQEQRIVVSAILFQTN